VEWRPLDLMLKAPDPNAALLLLDRLHSKEGQQMIWKCSLWTPYEGSRYFFSPLR